MERSATQLIIRMLGYAKPPTPLATTRGTRATQWLPNKAIFLIFYRPIAEGIEVVRVVSGYQDLEALFSD
ncbi:MAG: hypothetical protein V7K27_03880 [Nostoc sp.]|uniref:hypothetical protein n=1 Tax=Nostoc sp. TaxID=1180 RepID=UPI002FF7547E